MIPYGKQEIDQEDIDAVISVLKSDFLTQGPEIKNFEDSFSKFVDSHFSVAVNSATSALHISCLALGLTKGDSLWTSPNSFVASSNCALLCGAEVDFVDIELGSYNMCIKALKDKLVKARKENKIPKIIIPVHFSGYPCDMEEIKNLSEDFGFKIIEDASHAVGSSYKGHAIGDCSFSDLCVFSFHPVKIITSAEGGMVTSQDEELSENLSSLRTHGITRDDKKFINKSHGSWYFEQTQLGLNYRMTDIHAALGNSQLKKTESFIAKRHFWHNKYQERISHLNIITPLSPVNGIVFSSTHLYPVRLETRKIGKDKNVIFDELRHNGVGVGCHYIPIHLHPFYQSLGFKKGMFPNCEQYYEEAISLPIFSSLDDKAHSFICNKLEEIIT